MGRVLSYLNRIAKEQERDAKRRERERIRAEKERVRFNIAEQRLALAEYVQSRIDEASELTQSNIDKINRQKNILIDGVPEKFVFDINSIAAIQDTRNFHPPRQFTEALTPPSKDQFFKTVPYFSKLALLFSWNKKKFQEATDEATSQYTKAHLDHQEKEAARIRKLDQLYAENKAKVEKIKNHILEIHENYKNGDPHGVAEYLTFVLKQYDLIEDFDEKYKIAYVKESKELVIEFELPPSSVISRIADYRYVKTKDLIETKLRREAEIKNDYSELISGVCLLVIYYLYSADTQDYLDAIAFNGYVRTVDLATGKDIQPYLISVRTTKREFSEIDLLRVDKRTCLRNLGAHVSSKPAEMQPVKPLIDFNMVDKRFVEQSEVADDLDSRPNLMELNPFEFENLVSNLFSKMGLETKQTRSSKDGGVDAVAYDHRPVLGGKVIIQAKRYKNTVGVTFVRDLYGTMMNEGANKGILVTTSGYGPDAFEFAKNKPIELIDGGGLLYLLNQVGIEARIIFLDEPGAY